MPVTLRVASHQSRSLGADATRVFENGGTIGRSPGNDWVLPDSERFVSGQHAVVSLEDGVYMLTDRSTNGTIVNGRELPQGGRVRLSTGDRLTIGNYEISVTVDDASAAHSPYPHAAHAPASPAPPDALLQPASVDPLDFFSDSGFTGNAAPQNPGAAPDHLAPEAEYFPPPNVSREPAAEVKRAPVSTSASGNFIPEDWDQTGFSMPDEASDRPSGAPPAVPGGAPSGDQAPIDPLDFFDASSRDPLDATRPPGAIHALPGAAAAGSTPGGAARVPSPDPGAASPGSPADGSPSAQQSAGRAAPLPGGPAGARAAPSGSVHGEQQTLAALLRAAGLDPAAVDADTAASLGAILRVVVEGLIDVLQARAALKNQFRVAMTTLKPVENNPLKFSASAEDALFNLLARRGQSYQEPVDAFREAFEDLKAHQIAMMAGMRAAFGSLLKRFDPDELQTAFDRGLKRAAILDVINKTKYWELYREMYEELGDDDATFRRLFGDQFAEAYEEQMQRLTALHKR